MNIKVRINNQFNLINPLLLYSCEVSLFCFNFILKINIIIAIIIVVTSKIGSSSSSIIQLLDNEHLLLYNMFVE